MQEYRFQLEKAKELYKIRMIDLSDEDLDIDMLDDNKKLLTWLDLLSSLGGE